MYCTRNTVDSLTWMCWSIALLSIQSKKSAIFTRSLVTIKWVFHGACQMRRIPFCWRKLQSHFYSTFQSSVKAETVKSQLLHFSIKAIATVRLEAIALSACTVVFVISVSSFIEDSSSSHLAVILTWTLSRNSSFFLRNSYKSVEHEIAWENWRWADYFSIAAGSRWPCAEVTSRNLGYVCCLIFGEKTTRAVSCEPISRFSSFLM